MFYVFTEETAWAGTCTYQAKLNFIAEFPSEEEAIEYCEEDTEAFYVEADNFYEAEQMLKF